MSPQNTALTNSLAENTYHKQKIKTSIETNISKKLKEYVKIDTFDNTFYESFLEITNSASSKLENFKEENEKQRSLEMKIQF